MTPRTTRPKGVEVTSRSLARRIAEARNRPLVTSITVRWVKASLQAGLPEGIAKKSTTPVAAASTDITRPATISAKAPLT